MCPFPRKAFDVCKYVPPLKPLEAMAMGKPVIVSDLPPLVEMVNDRETGLVCQADNVDSLQTAIAQLYHDSQLRKKLATTAQDWVKHYRDWDLISKKYLELYQNLYSEGTKN